MLCLSRAGVLNLWGIPHLWGMASCQVGNRLLDEFQRYFPDFKHNNPTIEFTWDPELAHKKVGIWRKRLRTPDLETGTREVSSSVVLKRNVVCVFADLEKAFD